MGHLDQMTCEEAFARLEDFVDRELSLADMKRVQEHLEICAACGTEFGFEAALIQGVRDRLRRIDLPPDLIERINRKLTHSDQ